MGRRERDRGLKRQMETAEEREARSIKLHPIQCILIFCEIHWPDVENMTESGVLLWRTVSVIKNQVACRLRGN